jgi:hypothetical protein
LRELCAADSERADRLLTMDFSRYLWAAGLAPLIDPPAAELPRSALPSRASLICYAAARQYRVAAPGARIRKMYAQVWRTWQRLRRLYACKSALLTVFCRAGRLVALPPVIEIGDLTLYSVVVDISPATGHQPPSKMIRFDADHLRSIALIGDRTSSDDDDGAPDPGPRRR